MTIDDLNHLMGKITPDIAKELNESLETTIKCLRKENEFIKQIGGKLYPDIIETLKELSKDYYLYIVSNCDVGYIESFLEYYKITNLFKDIESYGNTNKFKSDNIKLLMKRNNIKEAIYIGDTINDLEAAYNNNLKFIYCSYGFGELDAYDYKIDNFKDILNIRKELN
jgi:phosphoglycolate phosphatase